MDKLTCNPRPWQTEARGLGIQGQPRLHGEAESQLELRETVFETKPSPTKEALVRSL